MVQRLLPYIGLAALFLSACGDDPSVPGRQASAVGPMQQPPSPDGGTGRGPVANAPFHLAVVGSTAKVRPEGFVEGADAAVLFAARNEFESFQLVINAPEKALEDVRVALSGPLRGPKGFSISGERVTVYRVAYYPVKVPSSPEGGLGRWPDPLIPSVDPLLGEPRNAFPIDVPQGENRVAWVDVHVPPEAVPGTYRGSLTVRVADYAPVEVPVRLVVLNFTLPSTTSLESAFGLYDPCEALGVEGCDDSTNLRAQVKALFVRSALDNRMSIFLPYAKALSPGDRVALSAFRTHALPYLRGTAPTRLQGARLSGIAVSMPQTRNLAAWQAEVKSQGIGDRVFNYVCDEPHYAPVYGQPASNWQLCLQELDWAEATWPEIPRLVTTHIQSVEEYGRTDAVDIMVLNLAHLHGSPNSPILAGNQRSLYDAFLADSTRPKRLWLYSACGSHDCISATNPDIRGYAGGYQIDGPGSQTRAMPWLAFRYWASGTLYYDTTMQLARAWEEQYLFTGNGEGTLFYPGLPERIGGTHPIPIESLRMKLIRDGYEDYEYLRLLRVSGKGAQADAIAEALFPAPYDTTRTDAQIQAARRALAVLVAEVLGGPTPP